MATEEGLKSTSVVAGENLSSLQYYLVKFASDGTIKSATSNTDNIVGVLQNEPEKNETAEVAYNGQSKVQAGGEITKGNFLGPNSSGKAISVSADESSPAKTIIGICTIDASSGNVGSVLLDGRIG